MAAHATSHFLQIALQNDRAKFIPSGEHVPNGGAFRNQTSFVTPRDARQLRRGLIAVVMSAHAEQSVNTLFSELRF